MRAGTITPHQVADVAEALDTLDRADVHPDQVREVEAELVQHCRQFAPKELKTLCRRYLDALDPDGPEPDEQRNRDRRSWRMHATPSGAVVGEFRLTPGTGAKLRAILSSLSNPRADTVGGRAMADLRTHEQRLHDAVDDLCSRVLRVGGLPDSGGTPATVIVTIDQADLLEDLARAGRYKPTSQATPMAPFGFCPTCGQESGVTFMSGSNDHDENDRRQGVRSPGVPEGNPRGSGGAGSGGAGTANAEEAAGSASGGSDRDQARDPVTSTPGRVRRSRPRRGVTSDGIALTVRELLALAGEAEIYPIVLTKHGVLLEMGRDRRIANKHQTLALIARDGGCSFPGCDHPPEWCERHHVIPWLHNGSTELANLTLLCSYHHHHFLDRGWQVRINDDGLPEWIPLRYLDPDRQPMINNRILARIHQGPLIP